jgi:hypothetical protein
MNPIRLESDKLDHKEVLDPGGGDSVASGPSSGLHQGLAFALSIWAPAWADQLGLREGHGGAQAAGWGHFLPPKITGSGCS